MKKLMALSLLVVIVLSLVPVSATPALACGEERCGCTLTLGYWKTHGPNGPAPYDQGWAMYQDVPFPGTSLTHYQIVAMKPKGGNAWYILSQQYIATRLTMDSGRFPWLISPYYEAYVHAEELMRTYSVQFVAGLKGGNPIRQDFINTANTLAYFNEGNVPGYPHCS